MTNYWFTYTQEKYNEETEWARRYLKTTTREKQFSYERCRLELVGTKDKKTRVVVRRTNSRYSKYMKFKYTINLIMGFVVEKAYEPREEKITVKDKTYDAWVINFDIKEYKDSEFIRPITKVKIWIEQEKGDIKTSEIYKKYQEIIKEYPVTRFFEADVEKNQEFLPVIYQPRIDAWKNFLREVHVHLLSEKDFEITLVFNDEKLRAHGIFDFFYRIVRVILHKRIKDVETFCMHFEEPHFKFPGIYSGDHTLFEDNIHEHKEEDHPQGIPPVPIDYFFQSENHPVVFINTSNHSMAEKDNNHDFWKWEYTPWTDGIPIIKGNMSREEIDKSFEIIKSDFWRKIFPRKDSTRCDKT